MAANGQGLAVVVCQPAASRQACASGPQTLFDYGCSIICESGGHTRVSSGSVALLINRFLLHQPAYPGRLRYAAILRLRGLA